MGNMEQENEDQKFTKIQRKYIQGGQNENEILRNINTFFANVKNLYFHC